MGSFPEVSVGDGILKLNGVDAGFIRNVTFSRTVEQLVLKTGNPRRERGRVPVEETVSLGAEFLELSMTNFSRFLGVGLTVILDDPVTINDAANQQKTFKASGNYDGALERIILDGPNVDDLVIKNLAESVTYVEGTDYIMDGTSKGVIRLDGGAIASGATVRVSYEYTPVASTKIKGGATFDFQQFSLEFRHPKVKKNTDLVIHHSIVEPSPNFSANFQGNDFIANAVTFGFIYDESREADGNPLWNIDEVARNAVV